MKQIEPKQIAIDFDSTLAFNDWPHIGKEVPGAIEIVKRLKEAGHTLILLTMREGDLLSAATDWLSERGVEFDYINCNPLHKNADASRKIYYHLGVDDHNAGVPLTFDPGIHHRPFVDWYRVKNLLLINKYL